MSNSRREINEFFFIFKAEIQTQNFLVKKCITEIKIYSSRINEMFYHLNT